jgi:hypothetical protein
MLNISISEFDTLCLLASVICRLFSDICFITTDNTQRTTDINLIAISQHN